MSKAERKKVLAKFSEKECESFIYDWRGFLARSNQTAPQGNWDIWMILAGRGFGKTRAGAEWVREQVKAGKNRIALVAETQKDLEEVMIEGESGLLSIFPPSEKLDYRKRPVRIIFSTGAVALGYNATQPDQLRGPQFDAAWSDELAKWRYARETWNQLQFSLRLGDKPRQIVTTTPRPIELVKSIVAGNEGEACVTRGRTLDNRSNLAASFISKIEARYAGTRLGRQELEGEILGDLPGALWRQEQIDSYRIPEIPENLGRIVVAIDPAVTNTEDSDENGLIVVGINGQSGYVLEDASSRGSPLSWARKAIALHDKYAADGIVVEVNQGGDMVSHTLRSVRQSLNIIEVRATRGKHVRAEPIAALYEQGRVHHVGSFSELENQMTMISNIGFEGEGSPDRLDALIWGLTELFPDMIQTSPSRIPEFKIKKVV